MIQRWQNQQEAYEFAKSHNACMLDMDMGTGKTRVAIDTAMDNDSVHRILIVCPKAVLVDHVWRTNLEKFVDSSYWDVWDECKGTVKDRAASLEKWLKIPNIKKFAVVNYDSVWRKEMGALVQKARFNMIILDESHRAKAAGSKVSKFLGMVGKNTPYRMCLSGTPMANSPLDVYGQYRFLDPRIFGTNHYLFLQEYAIMGGPDHNFVVGFKNQKKLNDKFSSIAYSCKMEDIKDRIKLPDVLPDTTRYVQLPSKDMKTMKILSREFVAECEGGHVVVNNVLTKLLRCQQITSGFCQTQENVFDNPEIQELNTSKEDSLVEYLEDISPVSSVVVFCNFRHDIEAIHRSAKKAKRKAFSLFGGANELEEWRKEDGAVLAVQIQAGAEGVDLTKAHHAMYYSIPHSLALYNQSRARLYRPGQEHRVSFCHMLAEDTVDVAMFRSLERKIDIIEAIKEGEFDFGYIK